MPLSSITGQASRRTAGRTSPPMGGHVDRSRAFPTAAVSSVRAAPGAHPAWAGRGPHPVGPVAGADRGSRSPQAVPERRGRAGEDILGHGRTSRAACGRAGPGGGAALVGLPAAPCPRRADRGAGRGRRLLLRPGGSAAPWGVHRLPAPLGGAVRGAALAYLLRGRGGDAGARAAARGRLGGDGWASAFRRARTGRPDVEVEALDRRGHCARGLTPVLTPAGVDLGRSKYQPDLAGRPIRRRPRPSASLVEG